MHTRVHFGSVTVCIENELFIFPFWFEARTELRVIHKINLHVLSKKNIYLHAI